MQLRAEAGACRRIDGCDGTGSRRSPGTGTINGIDFHIANGIGVFRVHSLHVASLVRPVGASAVVFIADGDITIDAVIDGRANCFGGGSGQAANPGAVAGGFNGAAAVGPTGGAAGGGSSDASLGGGGGGLGATGGAGGIPSAQTRAAGGAAGGDATITLLAGGGGGGGGTSVTGGTGGVAIQLVSRGAITIGAAGGLNAGGCGGSGAVMGTPGDRGGGGGGGAGGTILLEAPTVTIAGALAVNGGSGGGGSTLGANGRAGTLDRNPVAGGAATVDAGGAGGSGGAATAPGGQGSDANNAGGGGGAVGRIRINTRSGSATIDASAVMSPALTDGTTATQGTFAIQ